MAKRQEARVVATDRVATQRSEASETQSAPPRTHGDDPLLTLSQVGELMGVTRQTVSNWVGRGKMRCVRLPGDLPKVYRSEVNRYLQEIIETSF